MEKSLKSKYLTRTYIIKPLKANTIPQAPTCYGLLLLVRIIVCLVFKVLNISISEITPCLSISLSLIIGRWQQQLKVCGLLFKEDCLNKNIKSVALIVNKPMQNFKLQVLQRYWVAWERILKTIKQLNN